MLKLRLAVLATLLATLAFGAPTFATQEKFEQTYPLRPGGTFELRNVNGSVRIDAWDREEVLIQAIKTSRSQPGALERVQIVAESDPDRVVVTTRYPKNESNDVRVDFQIRVPRRAQLARVETVNGDVFAQGMEGEGELRSVNGDVTILDAAGRFSARTTNGNVQMEFRQLASEGRVVAETVNGSVVLFLPADAGAELDVLSRNGDFQSELPLTVLSGAGPREFRGVIGEAGVKLRLRTVNGGIRVVTLRPVV